jgi:hypothetical protein
MSETATTAPASIDTAAPAADEAENVWLLYVDDEKNPGPKEFVMHGPNLYFRRGALTGPVTATVAGIVTDRKKPPLIVIASEEYIMEHRAGDAVTPNVAAGEKKPDDPSSAGTTSTSNGSAGGEGEQAGTGSTAPADTKPTAAPATARKGRPGTTLVTG